MTTTTDYRREAAAAARWIIGQVRAGLRSYLLDHEIDTLEFEIIKYLRGLGPASAACGVPRFDVSGHDLEMVFANDVGDQAAACLRSIAYVVIEPGRVTGKVVGSRWVEIANTDRTKVIS